MIIIQRRKVQSHYILKSVTVSKITSGKYFASILFEYEQEITPIESKTFIGLDFLYEKIVCSE